MAADKFDEMARAVIDEVYAPGRFAATKDQLAAAIAALVRRAAEQARADEREACAVIAYDTHPHDGACCFEDPDGHRGSAFTAEAIAAAIRARGEQADTGEGQNHG